MAVKEKVELRDTDEKVIEIELERLRSFQNHPFKVQADSQMIELKDSIKNYGILNPLIVRPRPDVRCLIDEAANIGQIPNLEKLMATIRSREISAVIVLQAKSQLKAIYKDNADTIIGNCDSQIFLGGSEQTTLKDLNATLGKETIDMYNTGESRGTSQSYNLNYQKLGKDLMSIDELAVMDGGKCIVQVRGVRPFLSDKYDLTQHPNYRMTADYDKRNWFDIENYLKRKNNFILKADDKFEVIAVNE